MQRNLQGIDGAIIRTRFYQVGRILEQIAEMNDAIPQSQETITPFHSLEVPRYPIPFYFVILAINSGLQDEQAPAILVLIERLCSKAVQNEYPIVPNSYTIHR